MNGAKLFSRTTPRRGGEAFRYNSAGWILRDGCTPCEISSARVIKRVQYARREATYRSRSEISLRYRSYVRTIPEFFFMLLT